MTGDLYIDGVDAYTQFGVFVTDGGHSSLVQYPELKEVEIDDWPEEDGLDVDLSNPVLNSREFTVSFACINKANIPAFIAALTTGATHTLNFAKIGKSYNLRLVSHPSKSSVQTLDIFTLKFAEDVPFNNYVYSAPIDLGIAEQGYLLDGVDFSVYGTHILEGTYDSLMKYPDTKENLIKKNKITTGQQYDSASVYFKSKDVVLKFLLSCSIESFWTNYQALLNDLIQPDKRILTTDFSATEFSCYYKKSSVNNFTVIGNLVWCEFQVVLCVISENDNL